jgi:hypothetical protein
VGYVGLIVAFFAVVPAPNFSMSSNPPNRFFRLFDPAGVKKYFTQVSLILLSLLIASRAEKCREADRNDQKLREYLVAIRQDVRDEIEIDQMNLRDCDRDVECLTEVLQKSRFVRQPDSLREVFLLFCEVYRRGVFRAFPPKTFDMMQQSGDAHLLKDLSLRAELASAFAFRQTVIRPDLQTYDAQTQACAAHLGQYFDFGTLFLDEKKTQFLTDQAGFARDPHMPVLTLLHTAHMRAFHLSAAIGELQNLETRLDSVLLR